MPIIDTPAGTLEVQNAILSASEFRATQKIGVANSAPTKTFSVGDKLHVSTTDLDAVSISGNLVAQKVKVGNLLVSPTFDLASVSNVGNTTSNIIQFANATTGFVTTANVEIGGNISFTSNAQVSVDSNVVAEYTGPHPRQPTEKLLKKYPDIDFAAGEFEFNTLSNTFTQGGYTVTSSGNYGGNNPLSTFTAWRSFTGLTDGYGTGWTSSGGSDVFGGAAAYTNGIANGNNSLSGIDTSTSTGGVSSRNGAWIKLELPNKIKLSHIELYDRYGFDEGGIPGGTGRTNENVVEAFIYGSNNNSTWYELGKQSDHFYPSNYTDKVPALVTINSNTAYKYFIIQPTKLNKQLAYASYGQIMFYGREEGASIAGDTSIDTTLKSVFNIPLTDDYKMYIDGKHFIPGTHTSNNLVSGSSTSVIHHNATYDSTNKFWTLDGSTESNVTTDHLGLEGDTPHTVSMWFNNSNLETNVTTQQLFSLGNDKTVYVDDNSIAANTWHNFTYAYQGDGGSMITYLDGRKISDETVKDTYKQYPPFPMMDYHTGGYKVTASSEYEPTNAYRAWEAFNDTGMASNLDYYGWTGGRDTYNTNGGDGKRTTLTWSGSTQHVGEHIKLELPHKIVLNEVHFEARQAAAIERQLPRQFTIVGSNDDVNWETIHQEMRTSNPSHNEFHVMTGASKHKGFKYIALVVKCSGTSNTNDHISIGNLKYFGHKEGDVIRFPEPNTTLKYPHVTMTNRAQRGYVVKASSFYSATGNPAYHVFDNNPTGAKWATEAAANYGNGGNTYSGSKNLGTNNGGSGTVGGEWLFLELPNKVKLQQARIVVHENTNERPQQFVIYGSNDLTGAWTAVDTTYQSSDFNVTVGTVGKSWTVSTASGSNYYKYLGIVVTKVSGNSQLFAITQLDLFGVEENNTVPAVIGGPFHGKVANFRVYDTFLNEDRIKEIYDVDKDDFGHTKSTMTFHKGRIGVGTTEPQGSLAIVDECNAVEKFPSVNPSSSECFIEGQGTFNISSTPTYFYTIGPKNVSDMEHEEVNKDDSYKIFSKNDFRSIRMKDAGNNQRDKFTYDCAATKPHRNEQLAPTTDFGSWFKLESPRRVSLKTADIQCIPFWRQIGDDLYGFGDGTNNNPGHLSYYGESCDISNDGTRIVVGAPHHPGDGTTQGAVEVREWSGQQWLRVGQLIDSTLGTDYLGVDVGISGSGERIIIGSPYAESADGQQNNAGRVDVYDIIGNTWTLASPAFYGGGASNQAGMGVTISHDGQIIAYSEIEYDGLPGSNCGRIRVYTWNRNARTWSQRGSDILGDAPSDKIGLRMDMSDDGNYIIAGTSSASSSDGKVWVYYWNSSTSDYAQKGSTISGPSGSGDLFGSDVAISEDGNTILVGQQLEDAPSDTNAGAAYIYTWTNNSWTLKQKLIPQALTGADDQFGSSLDMSGDAKRIIIGAGNYPSSGNSAEGRVVVYEYSENADLWLRRNPGTTSRAGLGGFGSIGYSGTDGSGSSFGGSPNGLRISNDGSAIIVSGRTTDADGLMLQASDNQRDLTVDGKLGVAMTTQTNLGMVRVFNQPATIKGVWGSNDDKNWTKLTNTPKKFILNDQVVYKNLDNPNYFKYHAVIADHYTTLEHINLEGVFEKGTSILNDGIMSVSRKITAPEIESTGGIKLIGGNNPISYESDIVIEQPRARRIFKYPRSKLNSANDSGYQVSASVGGSTYKPWYAFGGDIETSSGNRLGNAGSVGWHTGVSGYSQYNGTDGFYSGTTRLGSSSETVSGEYLVLDLPERIALQYYKIWPQGYAGSVGDTYANEPRAWRIYGRNRISNDASIDYHKTSGNDHPNTGDERWTEISVVRDMKLASGGFQENGAKFYVYPRHRDTLFNQFAIVIEQRAPGAGAEVGVSVRQLEYYGYPEYDTENTGRDLQISSVPNTPLKDHCNILWDARNYTGNGIIYDESYRYDEVGESRPTTDGSVNCGFHDGDIKSFVFDGVYTSNVTATTTNLRAGDVMFTAALWVKKISDKNGNGYIMKIGNGGTSYQSVLIFVNNDRFIFDTWGSQLVPIQHIQNNRWYHIVVGHYEGNTPDLIRNFFYLDGQKLEGISEVTTSGSAAQFNLQGNDIILGASDLTATENFHGHVANIRIFNKALDHEEITQLYSSQKKYFGHGSDLILTGGKLGIGQMNPVATLDVHGDINLTGTILGRKEWIVTTWANSTHMGNAVYTNGEVLFKSGAVGSGTYTVGNSNYTGDNNHYFDYVQCKNGADPSAWNEGSGCFFFPESGLYNVYLNLFYNGSSGGRHLIMYMTYPNNTTRYRHYLRSNGQAVDEVRSFSEMFYVDAGSKMYFTSGGGTTAIYLGGGLDGESYTGNGYGHTYLRVNKII